jgi:hypothetical protein
VVDPVHDRCGRIDRVLMLEHQPLLLVRWDDGARSYVLAEHVRPDT